MTASPAEKADMARKSGWGFDFNGLADVVTLGQLPAENGQLWPENHIRSWRRLMITDAVLLDDSNRRIARL